MLNTPIFGGKSEPDGKINLQILKSGKRPREENKRLTIREILRFGGPRRGLPSEINRWRVDNMPNLWRGAVPLMEARLFGLSHLSGALYNRQIRPCVPDSLLKELGEEWGRPGGPWQQIPFHLWLSEKGFRSEKFDFGLGSLRVVTNAGVQFLVDALQNLVEPENLKFHAIGTGTNAEAAGDTALQTELTTQYNPDNTRATGSLTEGASANIFRTVGTNTVDASVAFTEHMIMSQAATGGGTGLDRSVVSVMNLSSGDSLQSTYDFTINSGG